MIHFYLQIDFIIKFWLFNNKLIILFFITSCQENYTASDIEKNYKNMLN